MIKLEIWTYDGAAQKMYYLTSMQASTAKEAIKENDLGNGLLAADKDQIIPTKLIVNVEKVND